MWSEQTEDVFEAAAPYYVDHNRGSMEYGPHSGDPRADIEYERQMKQQAATSIILPEPIRNFLTDFQSAVKAGEVWGIQTFYEQGFPSLSDRFFKLKPWPDPENVKSAVTSLADDEIFMILYRELYFRHLYARAIDSIIPDQRFDSYSNYCDLFNYILGALEPGDLDLPQQWLWDMIDEFIYQFQSFTQWRSKTAKLKPEELEVITTSSKASWSVHSVLNVLHSLVDKSNIVRQLTAQNKGEDPTDVAGPFGIHPLYRSLGYFSLIGLLRLHCLLGDYYESLKSVDCIGLFNRPNMITNVAACQVTTFYYVGYSYMMIRRYQDAINAFNLILLYIQRSSKLLQARPMIYDQIKKMIDKMCCLLGICLQICPTRIDENVHQVVQEKFVEKKIKMKDSKDFDQAFTNSCPKFISPVPPVFGTNEGGELEIPSDVSREPYLAQVRVFSDEVRQQDAVFAIRSYIKLYKTLPLSKLADFLATEESDLRNALMCYKHKMHNPVWNGSVSCLGGTPQACSDVDFYVDDDMIHIAATKISRRFGDFFIRQILKLQELNSKLNRIGHPAPAASGHM